ncbi:MAG: MBL fold metallo-hydrolase [Caldilineaceae bacterium]
MLALQEFRPNLWLTELDLKDFAVRGAVIVGDQRAVVWDTLSHPRDMTPVLPLIGDKELVIVYTHADWDHVWGTAGLPYAAKTIIGQTQCLARFAADVPTKLQEMQAVEPGQWDEVELIAPTTTFQDELSLALGGVTLTLHYLPGHTEDCIVGFIPEWGVLLAGDTVETPLPVVPTDSPLDQWLAALEMWAQNPRVQTVIPAHGMIGGRELIERNIAYLHALREGRPPDVSGELDDFYRETHAANITWRPA